jgi:hypothetical protein
VLSWDVIPEGKRVRLLIDDGWLFYGREEPHTEIHPGHMGTVVNESSNTYDVEWDGMPTFQEAFPDYPNVKGWGIGKQNVEVVGS